MAAATLSGFYPAKFTRLLLVFSRCFGRKLDYIMMLMRKLLFIFLGFSSWLHAEDLSFMFQLPDEKGLRLYLTQTRYILSVRKWERKELYQEFVNLAGRFDAKFGAQNVGQVDLDFSMARGACYTAFQTSLPGTIGFGNPIFSGLNDLNHADFLLSEFDRVAEKSELSLKEREQIFTGATVVRFLVRDDYWTACAMALESFETENGLGSGDFQRVLLGAQEKLKKMP